MIFKKTTGILLFSACQLITPIVAEASYDLEWNKYYSDTPDTEGSIISSGHTDSILTGTYDGVAFGNAYYNGNDLVKNIKSSNNEGIINSGVVTKKAVFGGLADVKKNSEVYCNALNLAQTNGNKVIFKSGSSFESDESRIDSTWMLSDYAIYGGFAEHRVGTDKGTCESVGNEVVIEEGVSLTGSTTGKIIGIIGGYTYSGIDESASKNKVKIHDPSIAADVFVRGGAAYHVVDYDSKSVSCTASENEVYFSCTTGNFAVDAEVGTAHILWLNTGLAPFFATANGNKGTFLFGDNVTSGRIVGGNASLIQSPVNTISNACDNELSVTGGQFRSVSAGYAMAEKATANGNKAVLNDSVSDSVVGGHAYVENSFSS